MKISTIIPAYNAGRFLSRAVESLVETKCPDLEIVIVEDGSTDDTLEVARQLREKHPKEIVVRQHPSRENLGVSASRNLGIRESTGELICFLDADDYVYPYRFERAVAILEEDPTVDGVYELCMVEYECGCEDGGVNVGSGQLFGVTTPLAGIPLLQELLSGQTWATSAFLARKSLVERAGGFPEGVAFAEDCNLWLKMVCSGKIVPGNFTEAVSVYRRHDRNTYRYSLERRVDLLRAMVSAYRWCRGESNTKSLNKVFRDGLRHYLLRSLIAAREAGRGDIVAALTKSAIGAGCATFFEVSLLRQYASILKNRLISDS